jgi:hypothetical protein
MTLRQIFLCVLCLSTISAHAQVFDVPYKNDAPTRTLLIPAQNPKAVVLLFPGGGGVLHLTVDGSTTNQHTFVRSKDLWAPYGIDAVLVDTPYDLGGAKSDRRPQKEHLDRIREVVRFYKDKTKLPIWLFGHSRGTISVTRFADQGTDWQAIIAGIVVAGTLYSATLDRNVTVPVLAIHHKHDGCKLTPESASESIVKNRPGGVKTQLVLIDGGLDSGDPCRSFAHHGFNQNEDELIHAAADFILGRK